jgi:hypothetical protein
MLACLSWWQHSANPESKFRQSKLYEFCKKYKRGSQEIDSSTEHVNWIPLTTCTVSSLERN